MNNFLMYNKETNDKIIETGTYVLDLLWTIIYPDEERKMKVEVEEYD